MSRSIQTLFAVVLLIAACGGDETTNNATDQTCPAGQSYNPIAKECVRVVDSTNNITTSDMGEVEADSGSQDTGSPEDMAPEDMSMLTCRTDVDGDGFFAIECGGDDCDDAEGRSFPGNVELCDEVDNNCDRQLNEGVDCAVLAHSSTRLYSVDFFAGTFEDLGETIANLWDIDTHPDGTLYGIAGNRLHTYNPGTGEWAPSAATLGFLEEPNGFCIDNDGKAYVTSGLTSQLRTVNLATGSSTAVGSMAPASSSGDCVVNKGNLLFMTSSNTTPDSFARIDGSTGSSTIVGRTGFDGIWGLTAAYNRVFGMTSEGYVVEINVSDGSTTVVAHYPDISFYGAASSPGR